MALNERQKLFVKEYLVDKNATEAAKRAGYSEKTAYSQGHDLLKKPEIDTAIQAHLKKVHDKLDITVERIAQEFEKVGFSSMAEFIDWEDESGDLTIKFKDLKKLTPEQRACISEISVHTTVLGHKTFKIKLHDKLKALEALGRYKAMFTDKFEGKLTGDLAVSIIVEGHTTDK